MALASIIVPIQVSSEEFSIYLEHLNLCLEAIACQRSIDYEVIIVDYISAAPFADQISLMAHKRKFRYVRDNRTDKLWSRGRALNVGIGYAKGNIVLFLDSDCIIPQNYVYMHSLHINHKQFTYSKFYNTDPTIVKSGNYAALQAQKDKIKPPLADCYSHQGFLLKTLQTFGAFDEAYSGWGGEDNDIFLHIKREGLQPVQVTAMPIHLYHPSWHDLMTSVGKDEIQRSTRKNNSDRYWTYFRTGKK